MFLNQACAWFPEITFMQNVCVCVYAPEAISNYSVVILTLYGWMISGAFQLLFMTLAVDVIDRSGPSNQMRHHLQPKKTKVDRTL